MASTRPAWSLVLAPMVLAGALFAAAPAGAQDAAFYQQDASHSGRLAAASPAPPLVRRWSRDLGNSTSYPLIVGSRVFVTVLEGDSFGPVLYALDLASGADLWSRRLGGDTSAVPAYHAGRVLVRDDEGLMRAYDPETGEWLWATRVDGNDDDRPAPPVAAGGAVFPSDGRALDVATGLPLWTQPADQWTHQRTVLSGSRVITTAACYPVRAREQSSGAQAWAYAAGCSGGGPEHPAAFDGTVWLRRYDELWPLDVASGESDGSPLPASRTPAFSDDAIITTDEGAELVATRRSDRAVLWRFRGDGNLSSAATVVGDHVFVGTRPGTLYALRLADGTVAWSTALEAAPAWRDGWFATGMNAGRGHLLVPTLDGRITAFAAAGTSTPGAMAPAAPPLEPIAATPPGTAIGYRLDPARTGALPGPDPAPPLRELWSAPMTSPSYAVVAGGRVHVVERPPEGSTLRTFDLTTGALLWSRQLAIAPHGSPSWIPLWHAGRVIVQGRDGEIAAFDAATGAPQWFTELDESDWRFVNAPTAAGDVVYAIGQGIVYALDLETGAVRRSYDAAAGTPALAGGVFYYGESCHAASAYRAVDGRRLWGTFGCGAGGRVTAFHEGRVYTRTDFAWHSGRVRRPSDGSVIDGFGARMPPALGAGLVVTANRRTLEAHDEQTGVRRWRVTVAGDTYTEFAAPLLVGSTVYSATSDGRLLAVDADTGAVVDTKTLGSGVGSLDQAYGSGTSTAGLAAGEGVLVVPASRRLIAYGSGGATSPSPTPTPTATPSATPSVAPPTPGAPQPTTAQDPSGTVPRAGKPAMEPRHLVADVARRLRATLRRGGVRSLTTLDVAATDPGRLSVRITRARDGRRLAHGTVRTSPAASAALRLRLTRRVPQPRAVVVEVRHTHAGTQSLRRVVVRLPRGR